MATSGSDQSKSGDGAYILKQATTREEMDSILDVIWEANYTPYEPFAQLFFPVLGFQPSDRDASIAESKERFWTLHQADYSSNWFYVQHVETRKTVGCAQWQVFTSNPFPNGPQPLEAPWWPVKEYREFCEMILNQVYKPRSSWMMRPHLALNWMAVVPAHRSHGVGSLLMERGIKIADEKGLEAWMEGSEMGKPLYEKFGFRTLFKMCFDTAKKDASADWRRMEHEMTPAPFHAMWRPAKGIWDGSKMPWELGKAY
ncbi:hypothetical protein GQ43DRAFT_475600 [Delitschia confertaspora ATCC 74209]|uniref:N-acetyltransferase domain-containing protein n=1 Tax=Delitschia confertaspora ATCC 74209 TaxID=1513339 RepID=A0A9P4JDR9_9PLEO|nr:hypothetical protein GQ43DRAFT_475600 [Delitschia confertaspora ATCC 74209]